MRRQLQETDLLNPYIALADMAINLVLILAFFLSALNLLGRRGWERLWWKSLEQNFAAAVELGMSEKERPECWGTEQRNDPEGTQRWVFTHQLFVPGTSTLTEEGRASLRRFASLLREQWLANNAQWRRIRIEGHSRLHWDGMFEDFLLSLRRAEEVRRVFSGYIPDYLMAVAGRGSQTPLRPRTPKDSPANDRVEVVIEFAQLNAQNRPVAD